MQRRNFLATLGLAIAAPWSALAARPPRIGFLSGGDENGAESFVTAMRDGLQAEGYTEPGTMTLDRVYADYALDKVPTLVAELQRRGADLIVTHAAATPIVVQDKERLVPAIYEFSADPIEVGIATDLAHPLFNATGVTLMKAELNGKRLEFLHELAPSVRRVAVIGNPLHQGEANERADLSAKAKELRIQLDFFTTHRHGEPGRHCSSAIDHLEIDDGFQPDAADLLHVLHAGNAMHDGAEDDRRDDHLNRLDKHVAERL